MIPQPRSVCHHCGLRNSREILGISDQPCASWNIFIYIVATTHVQGECRQISWQAGNLNQPFFGPPRQTRTGKMAILIPAVRRKDGALEFQASKAHCLGEGDEFLLHSPLARTSVSLPEQPHSRPAVHTIRHAKPATSDLEPMDPSITVPANAWSLIAQPISLHCREDLPIQLHNSLPGCDQWATALKSRSFYVKESPQTPAAFDIRPSKNENGHHIRAAAGDVDIDLHSVTDNTDITSAATTLEHLVGTESSRLTRIRRPLSPSCHLITSSGSFRESPTVLDPR